MRKNETSTTRGIVKRHSKILVTKQKEANTNKTTESNRDGYPRNPLELEDSSKPVSESPVIDTKRVETIKRAIEKGEYGVDCNRTAEKLLQLEDEIWGEEKD